MHRQTASQEMTPEETAAILQRILAAVEQDQRKRWVEIMFASVLFFGGIGGTFQSRRLRLTVIAISAVLFVATVIALGTMPICRE